MSLPHRSMLPGAHFFFSFFFHLWCVSGKNMSSEHIVTALPHDNLLFVRLLGMDLYHVELISIVFEQNVGLDLFFHQFSHVCITFFILLV